MRKFNLHSKMSPVKMIHYKEEYFRWIFVELKLTHVASIDTENARIENVSKDLEKQYNKQVYERLSLLTMKQW